MPKPEIVFDEDKHKYTVNGEIYPSVTTIIGATVPKDLSWWGMRVGCEGIYELIHNRPDDSWARAISTAESAQDLVDMLKMAKLTTNHLMRKGGVKGNLLHKALEYYATHYEVPDPMVAPPEERPRYFALAKWILEHDPQFLASEVRTASVKHRYAGTYDFKAHFQRGPYKGKTGLVDLKTTKYVYPESQFPQLEAYENAEVESGEEPTDFRAVLHLPPEGDAVMAVSNDSFIDFLVLLRHYHSIQARKLRNDKRRKRAA